MTELENKIDEGVVVLARHHDDREPEKPRENERLAPAHGARPIPTLRSEPRHDGCEKEAADIIGCRDEAVQERGAGRGRSKAEEAFAILQGRIQIRGAEKYPCHHHGEKGGADLEENRKAVE